MGLENVLAILHRKREMRAVIHYLLQAQCRQFMAAEIQNQNHYVNHIILWTIPDSTMCFTRKNFLVHLPKQECKKRNLVLHWAATNLANVGLAVLPLVDLFA